MITLLTLAALAVPQHLQRLTAEIEDDWGLDVTLRVEKCGDENAWYDTQDKSVTLCEEILDRPLLARAILRHEMGHALMDQWDMPWVDPEVFADEFAQLTGTADELTAAGKWFLQLAESEGHTHPGDDHPDFLQRAWADLCFADPTDDVACETFKRSVLGKWVMLIEAYMPE